MCYHQTASEKLFYHDQCKQDENNDGKRINIGPSLGSSELAANTN